MLRILFVTELFEVKGTAYILLIICLHPLLVHLMLLLDIHGVISIHLALLVVFPILTVYRHFSSVHIEGVQVVGGDR